MRLTKFKVITLIVTAALSGCSGSSSSGDDTSSSTQPGNGDRDTDKDSNIEISSTPVINLSGVVTLMEFEEVVEEVVEEEDTSSSSSFGSSGSVTASAIDSSSSSGSNLLGIDENGNTIFPVSNITDLIVNYSVLSSDNNTLYMSVSYDESQDYCDSLGVNERHIYTNMPLIGPKLQGGNENGCDTPEPSDVYDLLTGERDGLYYYCSFLSYDRTTGDLRCVGGTQPYEQAVFGQSEYMVDTPVGNIAQGYFDDGLVEVFNHIRTGLKPLQFDSNGNIYAHATMLSSASSFDQYEEQSIVRVSEDGVIEDFLKFDSYEYYGDGGYLALPDGDVIAYLEYSGGGAIFLIKPDGSLVKVDDAREFQADTYSSIIVNGYLIRALSNGGFSKVPMSWNGDSVSNSNGVYLSDEGKLYSCHSVLVHDAWEYELVQILPYSPKGYYLGDECNFGLISQGHWVEATETHIGTLGTTDVLTITRLSDGVVHEIFKAEDYSTADRYDVTSIAYGANKIIFSADRTSSPVGTFIGEVDVQKLSQGLDESEYLKLTEVGSSTSAANSVRDISPLPIIEPVSTASAPNISEMYHFNTEFSHVGVEFSEFMNRESVLESLNFNDINGDEVPYTFFWGYKKLYIFPDLNGFEDSDGDGDIDWNDYVPFDGDGIYQLSFDENIAMDVSGRLLATSEDPNSEHQLSFNSRAGFYSEFDYDENEWRLMVREANESVVDEPDSDHEYWKYDSERYRYFHVISLNESIDGLGQPSGRANYRVEWTTECNYYYNGIGLRDSGDKAERDSKDNFFNGEWKSWSNVIGFGYYCGDYGYVYGNNDSEKSDYISRGRNKFRVDSFGEDLTFYVYDDETESYIYVLTESAPVVSGEAEIWVASSYHYSLNFYDLRVVELIQDVGGNIAEGEVIAEDNFEDYDKPFEAFPDLEKVKTSEL